VSEDSWRQARLIPTSGISDADEQERRAASALLAVLAAVREFGRAITQPLGAPAGPIETFIEVPFSTGGRKCFVDGLIRVRRGQRTWTALVEVKTGSNVLDAAQLETYLAIAREQDFDVVLTIGNEISTLTGAAGPVGLHHSSWSHLLAEAVMQREQCWSTRVRGHWNSRPWVRPGSRSGGPWCPARWHRTTAGSAR
jgi:hypothetical protein